MSKYQETIKTYFIYETDGAYDCIMSFEELKERFPVVTKKYMAENYDCEKVTVDDILVHRTDHQYDSFYILKTSLTIEQVKKIIEQDFYVDYIGLCNVIGEIKEIKF